MLRVSGGGVGGEVEVVVGRDVSRLSFGWGKSEAHAVSRHFSQRCPVRPRRLGLWSSSPSRTTEMKLCQSLTAVCNFAERLAASSDD